MARMLSGGYEPRHARRSERRFGIRSALTESRGRYRAATPQPSAGLYGLCLAFAAAAAMWPLPTGVAS